MITRARLARAVQDPGRARRIALQATLFMRGLVHPLARMVGPGVMAALASRVLDDHGFDPARDSILVLDRLYFDKDVDILRSRGTLNYVTMHTHVLSVTQEAWLPPDAQIQVDYVLAAEAEAGWQLCTDYAARLLDRAEKRFGIRAVLASNVDYWQHEGFRRACLQRDMPFLVLNQELQTVRSIYELSVDWYRRTQFRYSGQGCAVFGRATAEMLVEGGACTPDQVTITGAPRLDPWLDADRPQPEQDTITLLAFDGDQYFAPACYLDTLAAFAAASLRHPHLRFVLKAKDAEDDVRARRHLAGTDHRLEITHDEPLTRLFPRSRLVIGYMSIAVMEALLSPAAIAVPNWGDAAKPARDLNLDPDDAETARQVEFLPDAAHLDAAIARAAAGDLSVGDASERADLVFRFFHRPGPGGATAETERFIRKYFRPRTGEKQ